MQEIISSWKARLKRKRKRLRKRKNLKRKREKKRKRKIARSIRNEYLNIMVRDY